MENDGSRAHDRILRFLKMQGAQPASAIAGEFGMTAEGARQHLVKLAGEELVRAERISGRVGRPTTLYCLTARANAYFPDTHAELSAQILGSVKTALGEEAFDRLMQTRERAMLERYSAALKDAGCLEDKLCRLVQIRADEGYMAEWPKDQNSYLLIENHCPICTAATACPEFCGSELKNFRLLLGDGIQIVRDEHIIEGARRCAYVITRKPGL